MPKPTVTGSPPTSDVGVLDKMMALCAYLDGTPKALPEISAATGLHRATAHRLLTAMAVHGLARQDAQTQWSLGPLCFELGRRASVGVPLAEAAGPTLLKLRDLTGESTQLYVRDGDSRVCVAATESLHGLRTIVSVGAVLPLDKGSAGKVLRGEPAAMQRGWAESVGEREAGVASVSAAIVDRAGLVRAAISVSGPIERTTKRPGARWGDDLRESARAIQRSCGWSD
jgi:DNA-binding IclR family transcriptional regulator